MLPTPDIPECEYEVRRSSDVANVRAALAALIIFLVCVFVIAARF